MAKNKLKVIGLLISASYCFAVSAGAALPPNHPVNVPVAPEPVSYVLFGVGAAVLWLRRKFKR
ncbi:MAG: PEP-CTERM sorting domain-containing protein [Nitrospiraceae bacterium]|nr:MAG: PEP-CTERM sorting domain-containing protein [Nitrospiraceae bacterium]